MEGVGNILGMIADGTPAVLCLLCSTTIVFVSVPLIAPLSCIVQRCRGDGMDMTHFLSVDFVFVLFLCSSLFANASSSFDAPAQRPSLCTIDFSLFLSFIYFYFYFISVNDILHTFTWIFFLFSESTDSFPTPEFPAVCRAPPTFSIRQNLFAKLQP